MGIFKGFLKFIVVLILSLLFIGSLFYINTTIYNFPESQPFSGDSIFNPYQNLPDATFRANFHAHSIAWKGVTNGHNTEKDIFDSYTKEGYDIAGISNYHSISSYAEKHTDLYVPMYEHGYNIFKAHFLSINSNEVSYFDFPLFQLPSHGQKIIENLYKNKAIISMAHPKFGGGRSFSDMQKLVGYDFVEVLNHYRTSDEYWDHALSSGRLSWIMGNDDTHDFIKEPPFRIWNIIYSNKRNKDTILKSMQYGKNYAISSFNGKCDNSLKSCKQKGSQIKMEFTENADSIVLIGQKGITKATFYNTDTIIYNFQKSDTYIRTACYNKNSHLYLNPIVRINKELLLNSNVRPDSNLFKTWLFRIMIILISLGLFLAIKRIVSLR